MAHSAGAALAIALAFAGSTAWTLALRATRPWLGSLAVIVLAAALGFGFLIASALLAAVIGGHFIRILCSLNALYALAAYGALRGKTLSRPRLELTRRTLFALVLTFGYGVATEWGSSEQILGGQDPGVYVAIAGDISTQGHLFHRNLALAALPPPLVEKIVQPVASRNRRILLSGMHYDDHDLTRTNYQFIHGLPALLAVFKSAFGVNGMLRVPVLMGLVSVFAMFLLGAESLASQASGVAAAMLLITNLAQLYFARNPFTEIPNQLLFVAGTWLLVAAMRHSDAPLAALAALLWSAACLVRPDAYLIFPPALLALAWAQAEADVRTVRWFVCATLLGSAAAVALTGPSSIYGYLFNPDQYKAWAAVLLSAAVALAAPWLWRWAPLQRFREFIYAPRSVRVLAVSAGAALFAIVAWGYWIRPLSDPAFCLDPSCFHMLGVREYDEDTFVRLSWYISRVGLALATAGAALLVARHLRSRDTGLLAMSMVGLAYSALFLWQQMNSPMHFWAFRRYMPMVVPFCALAIVTALATIAGRGRFGRALAGAALAYLAVYGIRMSLPFVRTREMQGSHEALRSIARSLPPRTVLVTIADTADSTLLLPLQSLSGLDVLPIARDGSNEDAVEDAIVSLQREQEVVFVCSGGATCAWNPKRWELRHRSTQTFVVPRSEQTFDRPPTGFGSLSLNFTAFELVPRHANP
jgi:hypothetical protein